MPSESKREGFLNSGELARLAGVSRDTLRHYERKGVLARPRRAPNGYREYPTAALERVALIQQALKVGFTLDELAQIFKERARGKAPCRQVRQLAAEKLADIETRLQEMISIRDTLQTLLGDWDLRLKKTRDEQPAALLESLARTALPFKKKPSQLSSNWRRPRKGKRYE
jgi:MerR family transcriptional regulator, mercuric resistance operon regulatory protein